MSRGRSKTLVTCSECPTVFHPWLKPRIGPPTCSITCARALTGRAQRGKPMTIATAGRKAHAKARLESLCANEFGPFSEREARIFTRAFQAGYDRGYPKRKDAA